MKHKKIIILISLFILFLLVAIANLQLARQTNTIVVNGIVPTSTPTEIPPQFVVPTVPSEDYFEVDGVRVRNFYKTGQDKNANNDVVLAETADYQIAYQAPFSKFIVTITNPDVETVRRSVEKTFLDILGIYRVQACKLDVSITVPYYINHPLAGSTVPLSFCSE